MKDTVSLFGFGRFGQLFYSLLSDSTSLVVHDPAISPDDHPGVSFVSKEEALQNDTLIYAVPIPQFESVIIDHFKVIKDSPNPKLFIDVLSVKVFPKELLLKLARENDQILMTHPMFGPDSVRAAGAKGQKIVIDPVRINDDLLSKWKVQFEEVGLSLVEMSSEEHDRLAARSQGLTHFIGRVLDDFEIEKTPIDTLGASQLQKIREQTCNDSWDLFLGLQTKNPYTVKMRAALGDSLDKIYGKLLPKQKDPHKLTVGIQGGPGSFNEEAARYYLTRSKITDFDIAYLYTTEGVLDALHRGEIDSGQFAAHNSIGGIVEETVLAMANYKFAIKEQFSIVIAHALMKRKDVALDAIDTICTHPQVLKQCKGKLAAKYPRLKQTSGEGELIDSATAAKALSDGKLPTSYAVMGSKVIAELYDLDIVEEGLQDLDENYTSFIWVERPVFE